MEQPSILPNRSELSHLIVEADLNGRPRLPQALVGKESAVTAAQFDGHFSSQSRGEFLCVSSPRYKRLAQRRR